MCPFVISPSEIREDDSSSLDSSQIEKATTSKDSFMSDIDNNITSIHSTARRSPVSVIAMRSQAPPTTAENGSPPFVREDSSWHYSFDVLWSKIPSNTMKVLDAEKRPSAPEGD